MELELQMLVHRQLRGAGLSGNTAVPSWKSALWEANSVEPAILRAPFLVIIFLFLWGFDILILEKSRIQYFSALNLTKAPLKFTFVLSSILLALYAVVVTISSRVASYGIPASMSIFYVVLLVLLVMPGMPWSEEKQYWGKFLWQIAFPVGPIAFNEILFADALCSLSKVFKDFGVTFVAIYAMYQGENIIYYHEAAMIFIAVLASLPFWIRIRQCTIQFIGAADNYARFCISINIIKYISSFPPIWLAAYASSGYFHPSLPHFIAFMATINSVLSFGWDFVMDWGVVSFHRPSGHFVWRKRNFFPANMLIISVFINLILRFSWAANRLVLFQALHPSHLILLIEIAEVFRRAMWNIFRVEWEVISIQEREKLAELKKEYELVNPSEETVGLLDPDI